MFEVENRAKQIRIRPTRLLGSPGRFLYCLLHAEDLGDGVTEDRAEEGLQEGFPNTVTEPLQRPGRLVRWDGQSVEPREEIVSGIDHPNESVRDIGNDRQEPGADLRRDILELLLEGALFVGEPLRRASEDR